MLRILPVYNSSLQGALRPVQWYLSTIMLRIICLITGIMLRIILFNVMHRAKPCVDYK